MQNSQVEQYAVTFQKTEQHRHAATSHCEPYGQFLGSLRGVLLVQDSDARWIVPATHGIWIPPSHLHAIDSFGPSSGWLVSIAPEACSSLPASPRILSASGLLREAVSRAMTWDKTSRTSSQQNLLAVILDEIATLPHENLGLIMPRTPALLAVASGILQDLRDCRSLEAWALYGHITVRSLSRHFVLETGFSFTQWRQRAKMLRSLEMLAEGLSITTISLDLGYGSVSAFIALFQRTFGMTPGRYTPEAGVYEGECVGQKAMPILPRRQNSGHNRPASQS